MSNKPITMIIPTIRKDYLRVARDYRAYFEYLPISRIVFIGPADLESCVREDADRAGYSDRVEYMDENAIIPYGEVKNAMSHRLAVEGYSMSEDSKPGWYYQQFLKMAYAYVCSDEYYISWDSDTIPLKKIALFDDQNKPYLDTKAEYNPGYFRTIKNMFGMDKSYDRSFIAEHMLFSREYMLEMISEIEALSCDGVRFYEKILACIDIDNMKMGFSEFETYGTWVINRHPDAYVLRDWKSLRKAGLFVDSHDLTESDVKWLAKDYDAASFESYHPLVPNLAQIFKDPQTRRSMSVHELYMRLIRTGVFGEYKDGMIKDGDMYYPI